VAGASTEFKRLLLKGLRWDAQKAGIRLREALKAACQARLEETKTGLALIGTSGNGASMTFALPQLASAIGQEAIIFAVSQLDDLLTDSEADLITAGNAAPNDDAILAEMLFRLKPRRAMREDYSGMCLT
jgi:hypothetical protein